MNSSHDRQYDLYEQIHQVVIAKANGDLTPEQFADFDKLLADNEQARQLYVQYVDETLALPLMLAIGSREDEVPAYAKPMDEDTASPTASSASTELYWRFQDQPTDAPTSIPILAPTDQQADGHFASGWPTAYLVATLVFVIGMVVGFHVNFSHPKQNSQLPQQAQAQAVAQITALADCRWTKQSPGGRGQGSGISEIQIPKSRNPQIPICLGDRLLLSAGLLQITYNSGAEVILQGPCTYEIDSARSGYLAVGKLTAKVEKGPGVRGPGSGNANHDPLSSLPSPLFAVRTPTAVVTDLGTEFGVEVEQSGATRSHVFQGSVEMRVSHSRRSTTSGELVEILHAGESARVERGRNSNLAITREPGRPNPFIRQITKSSSWTPGPSPLTPEAYAQYILSLQPVAYYRMEQPKHEKQRLLVFDSSPGSHHGVFKSRNTSVTPYVPGLFGKAMSFRGASLCDYVLAPNIPTAKDHQLTVVAWVMADAQPERFLTVAVKWINPRKRIPASDAFLFGLERSLPLHCWHHCAFVINNETGQPTLHIYLNGKEKAFDHFDHAFSKQSEVLWGIGGIDPNAVSQNAVTRWYWQGRIDEVAIFNKALSPETIKQLYLGGAAIAKGEGTMNE